MAEGGVGFPGAVVDEDVTGSWVSPPPAKPGIEDKPGQDSAGQDGVDRSDPALRAQHRVIQLGARTGLPSRKNEHGSSGGGGPDDAQTTRPGIVSGYQYDRALHGHAHGQGDERHADQPQGSSLAPLGN